MSNSTVIKIENLYKEYRLGVIGHGTLYRDLQSWWAKVRGKEDPNSLIGYSSNGTISDHILALNDINLEVKEGEVLGIIGKNGAGKSTLLKILSRVTAPSSGIVKVKGRIASLLEVGTGFHPELTGRENIFLNGSILGMRKTEIVQKFDEIVNFAEIEKFIDTPVKRYSSGMYVRLAFAVAAHLDPEILLVDEVLAVGDVEFQKKCLGKMDDISKGGRTILFVSHNMSAINNLCRNAILIEEGKINSIGETDRVIKKYLSSALDNNKKNSASFGVDSDKPIQILNISLINNAGEIVSSIEYNEHLFLRIKFIIRESNKDYYAAISIFNTMGTKIFFSSDEDVEASVSLSSLQQNIYTYLIPFPTKLLKPGDYNVTISFCQKRYGHIDIKNNLLSFEIIDTSSYRSLYGSYRPALVAPEIEWRLV